ncbi:MAG: glycosyltransferase [Desulfatibacillaceae bacterium]
MRVLWWGRHDPGYSRNILVRRMFGKQGWVQKDYTPRMSRAGWLTAHLAGLKKPDLVWVACFRHTDIRSAAKWARGWDVPLVVDPLISSYQKQVEEREKWPTDSPRARRLLRWERETMALADVVVCDTPAHARYFERVLKVPADRLRVMYVGAPEQLFYYRPMPSDKPPYEVLFFGSFIELQGPRVIVEAARHARKMPIKFTFLGDGPLLDEVRKEAETMGNIHFESWVPFPELAERIARAHIVLGVFGDTPRADLVIPNKVFQAMAVGRPVVTRKASAYEETVAGEDCIGWVEPADPEGLAIRILDRVTNSQRLALHGARTRELFEEHFSEDRLEDAMRGILAAALGSETMEDR